MKFHNEMYWSQIKAFSFLFFFVPLVMRKLQKVESINYIQQAKRVQARHVHLDAVKKYKKVDSVNKQKDQKTRSKN